MNKKLGIVLGVVLAVGLIASLAVGAVGAQSITPQSQASAQATPQATPKAKAGPQGQAPQGAPGGQVSSMDEIAKLLSMTTDEIWAARVQGKTLADLAKDKGVDTQKLVDVLVASQKTKLDQAVTDNRLTQAQADKWLEWYKLEAALQLTEPYGLGGRGDMPGGMRGGPGGPGGHGGMPGGMRGPQSGDQSTTTPPSAPAQ